MQNIGCLVNLFEILRKKGKLSANLENRPLVAEVDSSLCIQDDDQLHHNSQS